MEPPPSPKPAASGARVAALMLVAASYLVLARVGLLLDPVGGFASVVWAPTGLAIASVAILGLPSSAAVWVGAFAANLLSGAPPLVAAAIALGNTLEAVAVVMALTRVPWFRRDLARLADVLLFAVAALVAPVISASAGVSALVIGDVIPRAQAGPAWLSWWVGDCIGALLVAPAILVWWERGWRDLEGRWREGGVLVIALAVLASVIFLGETPLARTSFLQAYLVFPLLIWAAMRFEQRGAVTAVLLTSVLAVIGTARGDGPFLEGTLRESLFSLQTFMGILALSVLSLAAAVHEREEAARQSRELVALSGAANQAKSDFLAAMSHELRTPLNAIGGYAELLGLELHGPLTARQADAVQRITTNQRHLASLVDDVLSFTRVEAGRLNVRVTAVPVVKMVHSLEQFIAPEASKRGIRLEVMPMDGQLAVQGDPERVRQIMLNLLVNAMKFSVPEKPVRVWAEPRKGHVDIVVRDEGIGIPGHLVERVFEPFYQVDGGRTRRHSGLGLGLTISRNLARAMGGDVRLESAEGQGTTATLTLPIA